ncbi:MAG: carboxypeptidase regulatory-like domain-containing protein, partial [Armatimonadetes bacterium]|nr:carboxypeptidase regulatory-like domain-containing protein [Armatimonadota bacterium]
MKRFWLGLLLSVGALCLAQPLWCWTPAAPVAMTSQDSLDPRMASDANGKAHVVWRERVGGTTFQIWYTNNVGGSFSSPVQISQGGSINCYWPVVAVNGSDAHVAWVSDQSGSNFEIWYRRFSGAWGPIYNASNTAIKSLRPSIAARGTVGPVVAWDEALYAEDNYDVFFSEWTGSGFGSALNISNTVGGPVYGSVNSNVAISSNGDVTVVWAERITGDYRINARRRVGGVWQARQEISTKATGPSTPGIAVGPGNQVHVVYNAEDQNWYQKWNGSTWTAPVALPGGVSYLIRPKIAVDDQGFCHVVADNSQYGVGEIWYTTNSSGSWSPWVNISNTPNSNSLFPDIGYGAGVLTVIWEENSNGAGGTGVFNTWYTKHNLPPAGPSGTIAGRVLDQFGNGIPDATVTAGSYEARSGTGGNYSINLPVGTYTVSASKLYYTGQTVPNVQVLENQTTALDITITAFPPGPVTLFRATPSDGINRLAWTNPTSANFTGTVVQYKETGYPTSPTDGVRLCDRAASPGSTDGFEHTGLVNGRTYYYAAFAHDADGHYSAAAYASAKPAPNTCSSVKQMPNNWIVDIYSRVVTANFTSSEGCIYIADPNRTSGLRVAITDYNLVPGDVVNVTGTIRTRMINGYPSERVIEEATVTKVSSGSAPRPVAMKCGSVG